MNNSNNYDFFSVFENQNSTQLPAHVNNSSNNLGNSNISHQKSSLPIIDINNSKTLNHSYFFLCHKCWEIPYIKELSDENELVLKFKCSCTISDLKIPYQEYQEQFIKKCLTFINWNCSYHPKHYQINPVSYCPNCGHYLCSECVEQHATLQKDHITLAPHLKLSSNCSKHFLSKLKYYCTTCDNLLCEECKLEHDNIHTIKEGNKKNDAAKIKKLRDNFNEGTKNYLEISKAQNKEILEKITSKIEELTKYKQTLEELYEKHSYIDEQIIEVVNNLFFCYDVLNEHEYYNVTNNIFTLLNNKQIEANIYKYNPKKDLDYNILQFIVNYNDNHILFKKQETPKPCLNGNWVQDKISKNNTGNTHTYPWIKTLNSMKTITSIVALYDNCFLFGWNNGWIEIFDLQINISIALFSAHCSAVTKLSWQPEKNQFISGSKDNTIRVWDTKSFQNLRSYSGHEGGTTDLLWINNNIIGSTGEDGKVIITCENRNKIYPYNNTIKQMIPFNEAKSEFILFYGKTIQKVKIDQTSWVMDVLANKFFREDISCISRVKHDLIIVGLRKGLVPKILSSDFTDVGTLKGMHVIMTKCIPINGNNFISWTGEVSIKVWDVLDEKNAKVIGKCSVEDSVKDGTICSVDGMKCFVAWTGSQILKFFKLDSA